MCDYHSACFRVDGAVAHDPSNSHSTIIRNAGWRENDSQFQCRFVECEWHGHSEYPGASAVVSSGARDTTLNDNQVRAINRHYLRLQDAHANPGHHLFGDGYFSGANYADVRSQVAGLRTTPHDVLGRLASDDEERVRRTVVKNKECPPHILMKLASDADAGIRQEVAENESCPLDTLKQLLNDESGYVRKAAIQNRNLPEELFMENIRLADAFTKRNVLHRDRVNPETLRLLLTDKVEFAWEAAIHRDCPVDDRLDTDLEKGWLRIRGVTDRAASLSAFDGNRTTEKALYTTDGKIMMRKNDIFSPSWQQKMEEKEHGRYALRGVNNNSCRRLWVEHVSYAKSLATEFSPVRTVEHPSEGPVVQLTNDEEERLYLSARRLRLVVHLTKPTSIWWTGERGKPAILFRKKRPVALLMPIYPEKS